ncbi:unnamed protein product [Adineta ricciae]|uniref:guanylate cyclase n=1 Tax=Adineta ricciae TaxID=249248 RepID=A0A814GDA5_ADIRI|nr:unnamed protein product [Adineta ricciae]CAF1146053.1 unnamed protein product [Adineta ricciae]
MFYGIIMDTVRDGILRSYGPMLWKRIVSEVHIPSETFEFYERYDDHILINICDCMVEILNDGTRESFLQFFGANFIHYFYRYGFDKILRVAGRTLRDFLFVIDQLHDSNRFTFPQMQHPLFHVTEEDNHGVILHYKSVRFGLAHFAIGGLSAVASLLFNLKDLNVVIQKDLSNDRYSHIVFHVQFPNYKYEVKRLFDLPVLPNLSGTTFFRVFPFSILMDSSLKIHRMGNHIMKAFPDDTPLIGRPLDQVFRLIRPDIHVEWDKILSYGRHIVFLMDNRLPLRVGSTGKIRLKGQMKYIQNKNMLWFLCHPVLGSADDMISAGLHLTDLNLFDSTSDLLITGIHQEHQLEATIFKQHLWTKKLPAVQKKLNVCHKKNQRLLYSTMPKHIAHLLQWGVRANSICECQPLVTILFVYCLDIKTISDHLNAADAITCLNKTIVLFDTIADKYDVFKVEIKADASYMLVAGIHDQLHMIVDEHQRNVLSTKLTDETSEVDDEEEDETQDEHNKNPDGLNSSEIIAALSLEFVRTSEHFYNPISKKPFHLKFGFHSGMAIGGIVGSRNYQYCLFGDTVGIASQITTTGEVGRIHMTHTAYSHLIEENRYTVEHRGQTNIKGKGLTDTYWLTGLNEKSSKVSINSDSTTVKCPFSNPDLTF